MSIQDLINWLNHNSLFVLGYFTIILALSLIGLLIFRGKSVNLFTRYCYSLLVYAVAIPGIFSLMLTLYSFLFLRQNLLQLDLIVYTVPIIASLITLSIINKTIKMTYIPGFQRLSGLFTLIIIVTFVAYFLQKMFFGILIIGSLKTFLLLFVVLLVIAQIAMNKIKK